MRKSPFLNGEIYHVFNRGVEKREIFLDKEDRFRFVHDLYEFNDQNPVLNISYRSRCAGECTGVRLPQLPRRKLLVDILAWCLMPNHFHLLLRQRKEGGVVLFMRKLDGGYTNYFNLKYERTGVLFQGRFKSVLVKNESHYLYLPHYIHLNPLDLRFRGWKEKGIKNYKEALSFLKSYRWSSYLDYIGLRNFPSIIRKDFVLNLYKNEEGYRQELIAWLKDINFDNLRGVTIE